VLRSTGWIPAHSPLPNRQRDLLGGYLHIHPCRTGEGIYWVDTCTFTLAEQAKGSTGWVPAHSPSPNRRRTDIQNFAPSSSPTKRTAVCVTSKFRRKADMNCAPLGYYADSSGNSVPTFRDPKFRYEITTTRCVIVRSGLFWWSIKRRDNVVNTGWRGSRSPLKATR
jgi:hypothetical protein